MNKIGNNQYIYVHIIIIFLQSINSYCTKS